MHIYVWHEGSFWVSCMPGRKRVPALRARPQSSIIVAFEQEQTVTAKTLATVHDHGSIHHDWFYRALARKVLKLLGELRARRAGRDDEGLYHLAAVVNELPKTPAGKVNRKELRDREAGKQSGS